MTCKPDAPYDVLMTPSAFENKESFVAEPKPVNKWKEWFFGIPGILCGAVLGSAFGILIQNSDPSDELVTWIATPGNLFIRAIRCLVTPLVFCSLLVGMADMLAIGKAGRIGWRTALLYLTTTVVATCEGLIWVLIFRPYFGNKSQPTEETVAEMAFECQEEGYFLSDVNGTISCLYDA
uniref:Amino acid transporter n=1 Tax=Globisporangium ultimum (strain ATCC 200006 / CBS 805.95 / DAOM BR144) TaxID=431595 RepID=K3WWW4_GLOUD